MQRCVILNPQAGRGLAGRRRGEIERLLHAADLEYDLVTTHAKGGATELTYQAIERGYEQIVAVGGDGTINEVVNGILGSQQRLKRSAALGIVPLGTGSDFVKMFDSLKPNDVKGAVGLLAQGHTCQVDAGRVTVEAGTQKLSHYFINGLGMGMDAQVTVESHKLPWLKGFAVYLVAVMRAVAIYKPGAMTVRFENQEIERKLFFACIGNGRCQGGGFWLTPNALVDDGLLDVCVVTPMRVDQVVRYLPLLMRGTHTKLRQVTMGQAKRIEVSASTPFPVAADGEVVATDARRVVVDVLPKAITLVV